MMCCIRSSRAWCLFAFACSTRRMKWQHGTGKAKRAVVAGEIKGRADKYRSTRSSPHGNTSCPKRRNPSRNQAPPPCHQPNPRARNDQRQSGPAKPDRSLAISPGPTLCSPRCKVRRLREQKLLGHRRLLEARVQALKRGRARRCKVLGRG